MTSCAACQAENPAGAKFCNECGARLGAAEAPSRSYTPKHLAEKVLKSRAAMQGERKRVTVLFADIQGSTQIAETAGAENWHLILEGFFEILGDAVHRYEGTVNQYTGDGIMALFGAPIAHEDHAQRACLTALAIQQQMARYAQEMTTRFKVAIGVRVGLNSGEVVVGRIGDDLRMDYTAQGLTVNLAQRMESLCAPGRVTLSRNTAAQLQDRFRLRELGARLVHGVSEPIEVYELEGETAAAATAAGGWSQTQFIGREQELAVLQGAMVRVFEGGDGELALLSGGAGLGKTRLCREFGKRSLDGGVDVTRSACLPYARAIPLWPIRRLLREKLGIREGLPADEVRRRAESALAQLDSPHADSLRSRWLEFLEASDEVQAAQTQGLGVRRRLLDLVAAALLSTTGGQILLIEDLQWADVASVEFLLRLAGDVKRSKTLLLLNFRPDFAARDFAVLTPVQLALGEFAGEDLQQLVADWLGQHPSVREVALRVQERTGGNPFFLEEAVRDLDQSGYLRGARGAYELARPIGEWHIPDTVHALLAARMDRLPADQKELLQTVAVIGRRFKLKLLSDLTGAALYEVVDRVHALEAAGFVRRPGQGDEFALTHALIQEVAYHTLLESQRKALHARLAECLELQHPQTGQPCEDWIAIAHHWEKAGQWLRAGGWNLAAVQWASRWDLNLMLEQVRAAVHNLDRAEPLPQTVEKRIHARSTLIRMAAHTEVPYDEIERAWLEGRELAKSSRDVEGHARLQLSYGIHCLHRGDADFAAERATQAARVAIAADRREAAESFTDYVLYIHNTAGRLEEGAALARDLAGRDWASGPMTAKNYLARAEHGATLTYLGRLAEAQAELEMALSFAADDDSTTTWIHAFLVDHAVLSGDAAQVMQHARYANQRADAFGSAQYKAWALRALGEAHCLLGQHAQAVVPLEQARGLFAEGTSGYIFQGVYLATLAEAYRGSGQTKLAAEAAESGIAVARSAHARIQELQAWTVFLSLPHGGHWDSRVPFGLARMEELIAFTGASVFLPWWCQCQARWAGDVKARKHWLGQAIEAFNQVGATRHVQRLTQAA